VLGCACNLAYQLQTGSTSIPRSNSNQVPSKPARRWESLTRSVCDGSKTVVSKSKHGANRLDVDPSIELQPVPIPWGLLLLARLGDDHSIELQPSPQQTGPASIPRSNSNQVPSRGDCCCWPGSAMIPRSNSNQFPANRPGVYLERPDSKPFAFCCGMYRD
jgi:hypothetical protein